MNLDYILSDLYERFTSRKMIAIVIAIGLTLADQFGLQIDPGIRDRVIGLCVAYLAVEGGVDAVKARF